MNAKSLLSKFLEESGGEIKTKKITIPNAITLVGIALVGVYIVQIIKGVCLCLTPFTISLAGISDLFDGLAARKLNQSSYLGKFLDPLRDKVLTIGLCFGIFWISQKEIFIPALIWIFCEAMLLIKVRRIYCSFEKNMKIHNLNKVGQAIILLCVDVFLIQNFWIPSFTIIPLQMIMWIIAPIAIVNFYFCYFHLLKY